MTETCLVVALLGFAALGFAGLYIWSLRQRLAMTPEQRRDDDEDLDSFR